MAVIDMSLPGGSEIKMKVGDFLRITIADDCLWCYDDKDGCFSRHPMKGKKKKDPKHPRKYEAVAAGRMHFHAPTDGICDPCAPPGRQPKNEPLLPPHSIIVGGP